MGTLVQAPSSHNQSSRKGKRAWRKNVNIDEIQDGLAQSRDEKTLTGGRVFAELPSEELFQTDTTGSADIHRQYRKNHPHLKADQILAQRSAVPAVNSRKRRSEGSGRAELQSKRQKTPRVSRRELERLRHIAYGGEGVYKDVVQHTTAATHDPWADRDEAPADPSTSFLEKPKPIREPKTLKDSPVSLYEGGRRAPNVRKPGAGHSYNPAFSDWSALLEKEGNKEVDAEKARLQAAEADRLHREAIEAAAREADSAEQRDSWSDLDSEWEGIQSDREEVQWRNKMPDRKTPAERNKINRKKAAEQLERHLKSSQRLEQQSKHIRDIQRDLDAKEAAQLQVLQKVEFDGLSEGSDQEEQLRKKVYGRRAIPDTPLELVLPDELQDSLRLLKPEGNLLQDRFRNMLIQGKVEARRPVTQSRKAKRKPTEKWSYKDFKVPGLDAAGAKR